MGEERMREGRGEEGREGGRKEKRKGGRKEGEEEGRKKLLRTVGAICAHACRLRGELVHVRARRSWCCCCCALVI